MDTGEGLGALSLKVKLTPLEMLAELCRPCQFYYEETLPDRRTVKPSCRIGKQQTCVSGGIVFMATKGSDSNSSEKTLNLAKTELDFLKQLLGVYFQTFDWKRSSPFESLVEQFPGCSVITVADKLLRKVEKALGEG